MLVVKEGKEKDEGILALAKALQSEEVKAFIEENYEGCSHRYVLRSEYRPLKGAAECCSFFDGQSAV